MSSRQYPRAERRSMCISLKRAPETIGLLLRRRAVKLNSRIKMCQAHNTVQRSNSSSFPWDQMRAAPRATFILAGLLSAITAPGCTTIDHRAEQLALHQGLTSTVARGTGFRHQLFSRPSEPGRTLWVFIDGDGYPYSHAGTAVSNDPTPHRPLALELAGATPGPVLYVGRPCNFSVRADSECRARYWTSQRYSAAVVDSMVVAVRQYAADRFEQLVLIGYSGGGTLAVLMAPQLGRTVAVVTIAANLDIDAWTQWHGYLALIGSLNPSDIPPLPVAIQQWHLVGNRDTNAPPRLNDRYWATVASDRIWHYAQFDHVCCWAEQWPTILERIQTALGP